MKMVSYSDGEKIESVVVFEADLGACLTELQAEGYLIVKKENVPEPNSSSRSPQWEENERR